MSKTTMGNLQTEDAGRTIDEVKANNRKYIMNRMEYKVLNNGIKMPALNQCEAHVLYQQRKMLEYLKPYNVELEAWSPLAEGRHGIIIIPKTTHKERMIENISLFDFTLSDDDLQTIRRLDTGRNVTGWPSDALTYKV